MTHARSIRAFAILGAVALAACTKAPSPSLGERLPGTYTAHETAATITYVVKSDGSATLEAVTNLGEKVGARATYTVRGDTADVTLTPEGGAAQQRRMWTLRGDTLLEIGADKRTAFVRAGR